MHAEKSIINFNKSDWWIWSWHSLPNYDWTFLYGFINIRTCIRSIRPPHSACPGLLFCCPHVYVYIRIIIVYRKKIYSTIFALNSISISIAPFSIILEMGCEILPSKADFFFRNPLLFDYKYTIQYYVRHEFVYSKDLSLHSDLFEYVCNSIWDSTPHRFRLQPAAKWFSLSPPPSILSIIVVWNFILFFYFADCTVRNKSSTSVYP